MTTTILAKENYLAIIRNSVGANMFRNLFAKIDEVEKDIVEDGDLSCALFVSSLLYLFKMINAVHATVSGTVIDLESFGWIEITEPKEGAVVIWKSRVQENDDPHPHIGFITKNNKAISNDFETKTPIEHALDFRGREIEKILWNTKLN